MIYELSFEGHTLGYFPTEAEAVRRAGFLPKGEFMMFDPSINNEYEYAAK